MKVSTYMPNSKPQNNTVIELDNGFCVWFSYKTPIAFRNPNMRLFIRENDWSNTTGRHLNAIDPDKSKRIHGKTFEELLKIELWLTTRAYLTSRAYLRMRADRTSRAYLTSKLPEGGK